ncbi:hypothetical protein BGZ57DRAFT_950323 [Hyaloscypha finlandica]|nr:hypothetical protein BGZ57DRAFT_950323 [Hyaloscypha finlandica]
MASQEEAKQFLLKAWDAVWVPGLATLSELYAEDAVVLGFSPPKQQTWSGIDNIRVHFKEIQPIVGSTALKITNLDIVNDGSAFYATWEDVFEVKIPGRERLMDQRGIIHCVRKDGKVGIWTMYEDPTPFVEMAINRQFGLPPA